MDKEKLRDIIYILVAIIFSIMAVKLVIWLLPIIIIASLAYFIYKSMKKTETFDSYKKHNYKEKNKTKKKKIIIIDEENND